MALADHVPRTSAQLATRKPLALSVVGVQFPETQSQLGASVFIFVLALQRVLDELVAVLKQVGAELAAGARETVQRVEVELAGKLSDNTVRLMWLAFIGGCCGSGSRITAQGG